MNAFRHLCPAWRLLLAALAVAVSLSSAAQVRFEGLDKRQEINVRAFVSMVDTPCDTPQWQLERLIARAPSQIKSALEALGHYRATVKTRVEAQADCQLAVFVVTPGPLLTYSRVAIAVEGGARDDPAFTSLLAETPLSVGAVVDHGVYEGFKSRLQKTAAQRGYFDAEFATRSIVVDAAAGSAELDLVYRSGQRYRFGTISFDNQPLSPRVLDSLIEIESGAPYDALALAATHRNFLDSGYFQVVNVNADPAAATDHAVPISIALEPAKKRIYSGGLGFATDIGPRFRLNFRNRRVNSRGHRLDSNLQLSPVQSALNGDYSVPRGNDRREVIVYRSGIGREDTETSTTDTIEVGVRLTSAKKSGWLQTVALDATLEDYRIGSESASSRLLVPSVSWQRTWSDGSLRPPKGARLQFEIKGTTKIIGSDTSYLQAFARGKKIVRLSARSRLLARVAVAASARESLSELPPSARFFAGGDNSVRGYDYESLGPRNDNGDVIGGTRLLAGSIEIDWALNDRWALAAFVDSGSAFNETDLDFSTGVGFGVRRITPVGPVRVDIASPLDADRRFRLHISFGADL